MPDEPQNRSPASVAARALVVAKSDREALEAELKRLPAWQLLRRRKLEESLARARELEEDLIKTLGGSPAQ